MIGFLGLHAYGIVKIKDTYMIVDAAEPHPLKMVPTNLDKMAQPAKPKFAKFDNLYVFTKRQGWTNADNQGKGQDNSKSNAPANYKIFNGKKLSTDEPKWMRDGMI
ncbi:MAG: hypothetical protein SGARI_002299 [Bacillariaceae sp.]